MLPPKICKVISFPCKFDVIIIDDLKHLWLLSFENFPFKYAIYIVCVQKESMDELMEETFKIM